MKDTRDRDASVDRWLRQTLGATPDGGSTDACLDAETMAAWVDGGLAGDVLEMAQTHVAGCARCQAVAAAIARIEALAPPAAAARPSRQWLGWLIPLATAAAIVAVLSLPRSEPPRPPDAINARQQAASPPPVEAQPSLKNEERASVPQPKREVNPDFRSQRKRDDALTNRPTGAKSDELGRTAVADRQAATKNIAPPTAAPVPQAAAAPPPPAGIAARGTRAETQGLPRAESRGGLQQESLARDTRVLEIRSPDPAVRWRVVGTVTQRSTNGGSTWELVPTGVAVELTAGVAPSPTVCWLVGRDGVVLLSTDGRTWRRLAFPEVTDLLAIRSTDAKNATVMTADGRDFSTVDGGLTWVRRVLQEF